MCVDRKEEDDDEDEWLKDWKERIGQRSRVKGEQETLDKKKPSNAKHCLNHHLFQGPDLEVLSDVSTTAGVSVGNADYVCVLYMYEQGHGQNVSANRFPFV